MDVKARHVLSVELEEFKHDFILNAHTPPGQKPEFCLFGDVAVMNADSAYCYACKKEHSTAVDCDVFFSGPSCKSISYENSAMNKWANCYVDGTGCSGHTYQHGFKKAIAVKCPAVAFFENTAGVSHHVKDEQGVKQRPRIEVLGVQMHVVAVHMDIYKIRKIWYVSIFICIHLWG